MGAVNFSIDVNLVKELKQYLPLDIFCETGSFEGDTIEIVQDLFKEIYSIELSENYYNFCKNRFESKKNVHLMNLSSEIALKEIQPKFINRSVLYFFDAHWCVAENTSGEKSSCPLLDEIKAVSNLNEKSIIIIDDARLFISPPIFPYHYDKWPSFDSVTDNLKNISPNHNIMILNDTIVFYPNHLKNIIDKYAYNNSVDILNIFDKGRDYDILLEQLKDKEIEIFNFKEETVTKDFEIKNLKNESNTKDLEIKYLKNESNTKDSEIKYLKNESNTKDSEIKYLKNESNTKDSEIKYLKHETNTKDSEIEEKDTEIKSLLGISKERLDQIILLNNTLNHLHYELEKPVKGTIILLRHLTGGLRKKYWKIKDPILEKINRLREKKNNPLRKLLIPFISFSEMVIKFFAFLLKSISNSKNNIKIKHQYLFSRNLGVLYQHPPKNFNISKKLSGIKEPKHLPKISIVTPSYNQHQFIERTLLSVIDQNYRNLEYIIQDGLSDDGSWEIIQKYSDRFSFSKTEKDLGQSDAINKGFLRSSGEILSWLNSDDILLPGALNFVAKYFNSNPEVDVIYSHRIIIDQNDKEVGRWILAPHQNEILKWADYIPQETMFWRRRIWEKVGSTLDDKLNFALDWDLIIRFIDNGANIVRVPTFLGAFRVHSNQKTSAHIDSVGEKEMNLLREKIFNRKTEQKEIVKAISPFILKSAVLEKLWRLKILKY